MRPIQDQDVSGPDGLPCGSVGFFAGVRSVLRVWDEARAAGRGDAIPGAGCGGGRHVRHHEQLRTRIPVILTQREVPTRHEGLRYLDHDHHSDQPDRFRCRRGQPLLRHRQLLHHHCRCARHGLRADADIFRGHPVSGLPPRGHPAAPDLLPRHLLRRLRPQMLLTQVHARRQHTCRHAPHQQHRPRQQLLEPAHLPDIHRGRGG
mmetsp:Transcript_37098/g.93083  ORF Transcript_37098/g.93083 Transcript_37098/m.93083 type:complete len:205 (+) Transcript_37098:1205-1819(+)